MSFPTLSQATGEREGWFRPEALFSEGMLHPGMALRTEGGVMAEAVPVEALPEKATPEPLGGIVSPGFVDLQVNGGGGALLNTDPTPEGVRTIAAAHRPGGTVALLPTVITDRPEVTRRAAEAVLSCHGQDGVVGLHIEGPHINPARKGTHDASLIRPLDDDTMTLVARLRTAGLPVMLTLAPEIVPPGLVAELVRMGVIVSAGHTDATADQVERALGEGMQSVTHLYNAMSQMAGREPGAVGAAILSKAFCGIIADGHHVDPRMVRLAFAARPVPGRMIFVSDAMSTWNGPESFLLYGETIHVRDGRLVNRAGSLAGAHVDLAGCVRTACRIGIGVEAALHAATAAPAELMGLPELARSVGRRTSDLIVLCGLQGAAR